MYKRFVSSYEDADATLASPAGNLVHEFQDLISSIADSIDSFYQQADLEHNELECLRAIIVGGGGNGSRKSDASLAVIAEFFYSHFHVEKMVDCADFTSGGIHRRRHRLR